jgi:hypothetical protein
LTWKAKHFKAWQDDIEGEPWRLGRVSRDIWYFSRLPLLFRDFSRPARIGLSLKII